MPVSSTVLLTGSVVVPAVLLTIDISCPVIAFINELLPTFVCPNIPI